MQCYIILYSNDGRFLTFTKRNMAYFFHNANGQGGAIYPHGLPINNGPGLFAFPGGKLDKGEVPFQGCLREFIEECGSQINFGYLPLNQPRTLATLNNVTINGHHFNITGNTFNTIATNYCALYLQFDAAVLEQIEAIILDTNLENAANAAAEIRDENFGTYDAIFNIYPFCPLDNELDDCNLWQVEDEINQIRLLNQNPATDWYYNMIVYLANTILNLGIPY